MIIDGIKQQDISIADRALQYGDGCFTTMAYRNNQIEFFDAHIKRLKISCETLFIDFNRWSELKNSVFDSIRSATQKNTDFVVKTIITRGQGGRGYSPEGANKPSFIITHHTIPSHYRLWQQSGIKLTVSPIQLACQPLLAGIKHLNRLEQVLIKRALTQTEFDDAVVCDTNHKIIETSVANLFWYRDNIWYTSDLTESGVEGVMRNLVLSLFENKAIRYQIVKQNVSDLVSAEEIFVCNSLMGLVPVQSVFYPSLHQVTHYSIEQVLGFQTLVNNIKHIEAVGF